MGVGTGTLVLGPSPVPQVAWAAGTIEISGPAPSRLIGTAAWIKGKVSSCPAVAQQQPHPCTDYSAGTLVCLILHKSIAVKETAFVSVLPCHTQRNLVSDPEANLSRPHLLCAAS